MVLRRFQMILCIHWTPEIIEVDLSSSPWHLDVFASFPQKELNLNRLVPLLLIT